LIVVIFAGILIQSAELQSMVALDPRKAVGDIVDGTRGGRGVCASTQSGEGGHVYGRDTIGDLFAGRENIRVVEADSGTVQEILLIHRDVDLVETKGEQNLIYLGRANGPHMVDRVGLIGTIEEFRRFIRAAVKRLILP